jgi:hypothetical protein
LDLIRISGFNCLSSHIGGSTSGSTNFLTRMITMTTKTCASSLYVIGLVSLLLTSCFAPRLDAQKDAQNVDKPVTPPAAPATLEGRMQASAARQAASAAAMQKSVAAQKSAVQRQSTNGAGGDFFTLSEPARLIPVAKPGETRGAADANHSEGPSADAGPSQTDDAPGSADPKSTPPKTEKPTPVKPSAALSPRALAPLDVISNIGSIAAIEDLAPSGSAGQPSLAGLLLGQLSRQAGSASANTEKGPATPRSNGTLDYIRQILGAGSDFSTGSALLLGLGADH